MQRRMAILVNETLKFLKILFGPKASVGFHTNPKEVILAVFEMSEGRTGIWCNAFARSNSKKREESCDLQTASL